MRAIGEDRRAALSALAWLVAVGADEAIGAAPVDRLSGRAPSVPGRTADMTPAKPAAPAASAPAIPPAFADRPEPESPPMGTPAAALAARDLAQAAQSLAELKDAIARFEGMTLKATATNLVFADGNPESPLMLIGEAPGAEEDRRGVPFVGASGQLLDRMLAAIGRDRSNAYITNIVNWRPPGNRKPSPAEMALSRPFVERHIALVRPSVILLLGDAAAKTLTDRTEGITRLRGRWYPLSQPDLAAPIPAMATFHPAFLLRTPAQKREVWIDLLTVRRKLVELGL
jgi:DNA polymerase